MSIREFSFAKNIFQSSRRLATPPPNRSFCLSQLFSNRLWTIHEERYLFRHVLIIVSSNPSRSVVGVCRMLLVVVVVVILKSKNPCWQQSQKLPRPPIHNAATSRGKKRLLFVVQPRRQLFAFPPFVFMLDSNKLPKRIREMCFGFGSRWGY